MDLVGTSGAASTTVRPPTFATNGNGSVVTIGPGGSISGFTITGGTASFGSGLAVNGIGTEIHDNIFEYNTESSGGYGAAIGGNNSSPIIERNIFRYNVADSQFLSGVVSFVNCSSPYIANNIFYGNMTRAINMTLPYCAQPIVANNTMVDNEAGIYVDGRIGATQQVYRNNLIYDNLIGMQVQFYQGTFPCTWENNLVFGNGVDYSGCPDQTGASGNISEAPLLVDSNGHDFHLLPTSPAIDAGAPGGAPPTDFDGVQRPLDGNGDQIAAFDIGAYEYPGSAVSYDACLQDDRTGDVLRFNTTTGEYLFVSCASQVSSVGIGRIRRQGNCVVQLTASGRVSISATDYTCAHRGQALIRVPGNAFRITDSDTRDDTCTCGGGSATL